MKNLIILALVFSSLAFLPAFSQVAQAAGCARPSCAYNGGCYPNGTTYNGYKCSDGNIVKINSSNPAPTPASCSRPSCAYNGQCYSNGTTYQGFKCSNGDIVSIPPAEIIPTSIPYIIPSISINSSGASVTINNTSNSSVPLTLVSYKIYDSVLSHQVVFDHDSANVAAHSVVTLRVNVANCATQADLYYGLDVKSAGSKELSSAVYQASFCSDNPAPTPNPVSNQIQNQNQIIQTPNTPNLSGSCTVNPSSVNIGGYLNWGASASGGIGSYNFSWSGTDGLSGNASFVSRAYPNAGTKTGTVAITSGSQSVTYSCSAVVNPNQIVNNDLAISCSANPSSVSSGNYINWNAYASGGNGSYIYNWTGTDGLSGGGSYASNYYSNPGTKTGTVTVTSNGQSASASCTAVVNQQNNYYTNSNINVSCYASPYNSQVGSQMNWYANVSGGNGSYSYSWNGIDGLDSTNQSPYITYYTPGTKSATITIYSGGQSVSSTCYTNVMGQNSVLAFSQVNQTPLVAAVSLSQIPYTGLADNLKLYFFIGLLALISAWISYVVISFKKEHPELN